MAAKFWTDAKKKAAFESICTEIATSKKSLRKLCTLKKNPSVPTFMEWLRADDDFANQYAQARVRQADFLAGEIVEIADNAKDPKKARVQIDARKWVAGKMKPKVYGDRLQLDGDMTLKLTDEQLNSRLSNLLGKAGATGSTGGEGEA